VSTHINLLDWRKARREKRKQEFATGMGLGLALAAAVVGLAYMNMSGAYDYQVARNDYLRQQIKEMDKKITEIKELERVRSNLLARMRVIEELQASRSAMVHFFDEIIVTLPEGINLTSIKQQGSNVTIDGVAESNGRISTYMKNLDASPWFENPRLIVIKTNEKDRQRNATFQLQVKALTKPNADSAPADNEEVSG
jgi:type IV pilus assembly protein PilN